MSRSLHRAPCFPEDGRTRHFRGGRFDAILEVFGEHQPALAALDAQPMQEVLAPSLKVIAGRLANQRNCVP